MEHQSQGDLTKSDLTKSDLTKLSDSELMSLERQIAKRYIGRLSWFMVAWPVLNLAVWVSLWPLVLSGTLSIWAAFPLAALTCILAYLPCHDAQHDIYGRPGDQTRWLNQMIGHLSPIPIALSYRFLRETHIEHHKHANNPALDPDYPTNSGNSIREFLSNVYLSMQPNSEGQVAYMNCLTRLDTDEARKAIRDQVLVVLVQHGILFAMAANGHALTAFILWWVPLKIALFYNRFYLSWLPHFPDPQRGRYRDTHSFTSWLGNLSSLGMTAHVVHHLHPRIPLDLTPAAMRDLKPVLLARGVDLGSA